MSTSDNRKTITESEYERIIDRAVQNRLQRSSRYRNAANAEEQSAAEEAITLEVERDYAGRYKIAGHEFA